MRQWMTRLLAVIAVAAGGWVFTQGPLTPAPNLRVKSDANGYLVATAYAQTAPIGPLTPFGNIRLRTDSNGYLAVTVAGGTITPDKVLLADGTAAAPSLTFTSETTKGVYSPATGVLGFSVPNNGSFRFYENSNNVIYADDTLLTLTSAMRLAWGSSGIAAEDVFLQRDAANTLALRNGTAAQTLNTYGTYADASNYTRLRFGYSSGAAAFMLGVEQAGTGAAAPLYVGTAGSQSIVFVTNGLTNQRWEITNGGNLQPWANGTLTLGASTKRAANVYSVLGNFSGAVTIGNTVGAAVAVASTHKVTIDIGGTTYYLLATNVP